MDKFQQLKNYYTVIIKGDVYCYKIFETTLNALILMNSFDKLND